MSNIRKQTIRVVLTLVMGMALAPTAKAFDTVQWFICGYPRIYDKGTFYQVFCDHEQVHLDIEKDSTSCDNVFTYALNFGANGWFGVYGGATDHGTGSAGYHWYSVYPGSFAAYPSQCNAASFNNNYGKVIGDLAINSSAIYGWACNVGHTNQLTVDIYAGMELITTATANINNNNTGVANMCGTGEAAHEFSIPITDQIMEAYGNMTVYIEGISAVAGQGNAWLSHSGTYVLPILTGVASASSSSSDTSSSSSDGFVIGGSGGSSSSGSQSNELIYLETYQ